MKYNIFFIILLINLLQINSYYQRKPTSKPISQPTPYPTTRYPTRPTCIHTPVPSSPTAIPTFLPTAPTLEPSTRYPTVYDFKKMNYSGYIAVCVLVPYTVIGCTCIISFIVCCGKPSGYKEPADNNV
jgi:hypothetical protein